MRYWCNTLVTGLHCSHQLKNDDPQCKGCESSSKTMGYWGQKWAQVMKPVNGTQIQRDQAHEKMKARKRMEIRFESRLGESLK